MDDISQLVDSARAYRIQETPYFKRLRMREESDLRHLREAQEIVQQSAKDFLELQLRRIRLNKLYNDIHQNIEKSSCDNKTKGQQRIHKVFCTFDEIRKSRISMARRRGNEYSRQNRGHFEIMPKDDTKMLNKKYDNVFIKRKMYGQQVSKFNLRKLQKFKQYPSNLNEGIISMKRNKKDDYGTYYTLRNRLNYKDTLGEYDDEYTDLLMKCVSFEKEHLDVCGFLEEKLKSNYGDINKIISRVTNKSENENLLDQGISSTVSCTTTEHEDETEIASISLQNEPSNKNTLQNTNYGKNNETYQTVTRIDKRITNNGNTFLQDVINNPEIFASETVLHKNRYLNSVEEENENENDEDSSKYNEDVSQINNSNTNDNTSNDNNSNNNNNNNQVNDENDVVIEDSDAVNDESIPTIYQSQHSIHDKLQNDIIFQTDLNLNMNNFIDNLDVEPDTYRNTSAKSSDLDASVLSSSQHSGVEINELTDIKNVDNDYVDYDNISEKSRRFEEELESLRYTEEDMQNISTYVKKNNFVLEDVISDMIENSRIDGTPLNFYKLLSNIYLAYGMNLIKSSVDDKHIDLNVIKSAAEKQNASMSHALHVIFSSR